MKNGASGMVLSLPTRTVSRGGAGAAAAGAVAGAVGAAGWAGGAAGALGWQAPSGSTTSAVASQRRQDPAPLGRKSAVVAGRRRSCKRVPLNSRIAEQVSIGSRALDKDAAAQLDTPPAAVYRAALEATIVAFSR